MDTGQGAASNSGCSFVDFQPKCLKGSRFPANSKFETFDALIERANGWLTSNPQWKVISCESIESKLGDWNTNVPNPVDTSTSFFDVSDSMSSFYNRSLRLWICSKTAADIPEPQQLGYLNIVPGVTSPAGVFKNPTFQNFAETIQGFNAMLAQNPIQGRIINIETQNLKMETWDGSVDADSCFWQERADFRLYQVNIMRLFFEAGQGTINQIGTADFVPGQLTGQKLFSPGSFETFGATMTKVNTWIAQQPPNLNICNVQSIDYKVNKGWDGGNLDTMQSFYTESDTFSTDFIKIIRVYWAQGADNMSRQNPQQVTYRTFLPAQLTKPLGLGWGKYEIQEETLKRAQAWCNATGAKVVACETVKLRMDDHFQDGDPEVTPGRNKGNFRQHNLWVLRLYLDGAYNDPPPEVLPPVPEIQQEQGCCILL